MKRTSLPQPETGVGLDNSPDCYLTKQQVARHLNVSTRTIDSLMRARRIGFLRITRKLVRFRRNDVDDYLARNFRVNAVGE